MKMVVSESKMDDIELSSGDSENEDIEKKEIARRHKRLLKDIDALSGKSKKWSLKSTRNEPSQDISEYAWSVGHGSSNKLQLHELVGSLQSSSQPIAKIKKKLRKMENTTKVLEKPLTTPETQRIERTVAYQNVSNEVSKWNLTVEKNREAEQLVFPLNRYKPAPMSTKMFITNFQPQNDLEREINAVLRGSKHLLERKDKELTEAEENALKTFDLEQAMERRKELQRTRVLQSYYETRCRRMKKIKSKKYHRILKKEQQKVLGKLDLEMLSKENPELFQSELEKAEKMRAMERATLRHRNTSKWAKNLITKGIKSKEEQERIREQLRISRQLTDQKTTVSDSEDEEEANDKNESSRDLNLLNKSQQADNPWLLAGPAKVTDGTEDLVSSEPVRKLHPIVTEESRQYEQNDDKDDDASSGDEWDAKIEPVIKEKKKKKSKMEEKAKKKKRNKSSKLDTRIDINITLSSDDVESIESEHEYEGLEKLDKPDKIDAAPHHQKRKQQINGKEKKISFNKNKTHADPLKFLKSDTDLVELATVEESSDEEEIVYDSEQRMNIREAFANDDVIGDFLQEKDEIIEKSKPKAVDLTLPGWGEWAGAGLTVSKKKRKRFTKARRPAPKRKDEGMSNVILSEARNKKLSQHQVTDVPFPYSSKAEFERSIRQPIGELWNTPSVHSRLTEPRIRTIPGVVIEPLKPSHRMKKKLKQMSK